MARSSEPQIVEGRGSIIAEWDFSLESSTSHIVDIGPHGYHGTAVNHPQRAVTGHTWTGNIMHFELAPEQYGAISFHSDDLTDAGWKPTCIWIPPGDLASGFYGLELDTEEGYDCVPFVVRPPSSRRSADVAMLVPTFSYLAYANERHWWKSPAIEAIAGARPEPLSGKLEAAAIAAGTGPREAASGS